MTNKEFKLDKKNRYKGIVYQNNKYRWSASFKFQGERFYIGTFKNLNSAIDAYDNFVINKLGVAAITNRNLINVGKLNNPNDNPIDKLINPRLNISIPDLDGELWKDIPNYEGLYMASNLGRIKSLDRKRKNKKKGYTTITLYGRLLKSAIDRDGYLNVVLCNDNGHKTYKVHQLIAITFIDNINRYPEVHHKNNIRNDNRLNNLEWTTNKINQFYKCKTYPKLKTKRKTDRRSSLVCSISKASKINVEKAKEIRILYDTQKYTHQQLADKFNVTCSHITNIINYKSWKYVE